MQPQLSSEPQLRFEPVAEPPERVTAIVVAAGNATRMGRDKQMIPLLGIPVLARSLHAFDLCPFIRHIVVVARESAIAAVDALCRQYEIAKLTRIVPGGDTRQESVLHGVRACPEDTEYYAIHDGARPLVTQDCIRSAIQGAVRYGAAAAGMRVKDTIKRIGAGGRVLKTPERDGLVAVQTPQVFRRELYHEAVRRSAGQGWEVTDDCALCERAGFEVYITPGCYSNIKITTQEDVAIAEALLCQQRQEEISSCHPQ